MSLINISNLTFAYDGSYDDVFTNISFQLDTDWKLGLCGRNGRGKTTLLKLLMGEYEYSGIITASVEFVYFPYTVKAASDMVIDVLEAVDSDMELWQVRRELTKLAVSEDVLYRQFDTLSSGEQTKVLLAGLFSCENRFLLIDEPTNHLDMEARGIVSRYLGGKQGFILVSHDRAFLDECIDHVLSINKESIDIMQSDFSGWWEQKQREDAYELGLNERLAKEVDRLQAAAARTARWSDQVEKSKRQPQKSGLSVDTGYIGHKSAKMMKRSKVAQRRREDAIEEKSALLKDIEMVDDLEIRPLMYHTSRLLSVEGLSVSYGSSEVFRDINFTLRQGERLAIQGGNGSGKSSIVKLLCGQDIPHTGQVDIGSRLIISYVPQDASFLSGDLRDYARAEEIDESVFKAILSKLDFSRVQFEKDIADFSAGQKKKVLIAASLCKRAHLYVWDEPLNYIDVFSRVQIEELIFAYSPTMVFVEHDRTFCENIATNFLSLY